MTIGEPHGCTEAVDTSTKAQTERRPLLTASKATCATHYADKHADTVELDDDLFLMEPPSSQQFMSQYSGGGPEICFRRGFPTAQSRCSENSQSKSRVSACYSLKRPGQRAPDTETDTDNEERSDADAPRPPLPRYVPSWKRAREHITVVLHLLLLGTTLRFLPVLLTLLQSPPPPSARFRPRRPRPTSLPSRAPRRSTRQQTLQSTTANARTRAVMLRGCGI